MVRTRPLPTCGIHWGAVKEGQEEDMGGYGDWEGGVGGRGGSWTHTRSSPEHRSAPRPPARAILQNDMLPSRPHNSPLASNTAFSSFTLFLGANGNKNEEMEARSERGRNMVYSDTLLTL